MSKKKKSKAVQKKGGGRKRNKRTKKYRQRGGTPLKKYDRGAQVYFGDEQQQEINRVKREIFLLKARLTMTDSDQEHMDQDKRDQEYLNLLEMEALLKDLVDTQGKKEFFEDIRVIPRSDDVEALAEENKLYREAQERKRQELREKEEEVKVRRQEIEERHRLEQEVIMLQEQERRKRDPMLVAFDEQEILLRKKATEDRERWKVARDSEEAALLNRYADCEESCDVGQKLIDLKKISYKKPDKNKPREGYKWTVPSRFWGTNDINMDLGTFTYESDNGHVDLAWSGKIGSGTNKVVYLYSGRGAVNSQIYKIAVARFLTKDDVEINTIKEIEKDRGKLCNVINASVVGGTDPGTEPLVLMNYVEGDLLSIFDNVPDEYIDIHDIEQQLIRNLYCLWRNGIFYTDLKPENILYTRETDDIGGYKIKILFGDIDSLCGGITKNTEGVASYPYFPPGFKPSRASDAAGMIPCSSEESKAWVLPEGWKVGVAHPKGKKPRDYYMKFNREGQPEILSRDKNFEPIYATYGPVAKVERTIWPKEITDNYIDYQTKAELYGTLIIVLWMLGLKYMDKSPTLDEWVYANLHYKHRRQRDPEELSKELGIYLDVYRKEGIITEEDVDRYINMFEGKLGWIDVLNPEGPGVLAGIFHGLAEEQGTASLAPDQGGRSYSASPPTDARTGAPSSRLTDVQTDAPSSRLTDLMEESMFLVPPG
jgi:serine/threonine protein kinase